MEPCFIDGATIAVPSLRTRRIVLGHAPMWHHDVRLSPAAVSAHPKRHVWMRSEEEEMKTEAIVLNLLAAAMFAFAAGYASWRALATGKVDWRGVIMIVLA